MDAKFIEDLARKLAANVPGSVRVIQADLERNFQALLASTFDKLNLVTREEFDVQRKVLERTRDKLSGTGGGTRGHRVAPDRQRAAEQTAAASRHLAMRLATTLTRAQLGLKAPEVVVEAHVGGGLPQFTIIGLIETAVRESRDRVRAAISQSGLEFPDRADHRQPRTCRSAQGRQRL